MDSERAPFDTSPYQSAALHVTRRRCSLERVETKNNTALHKKGGTAYDLRRVPAMCNVELEKWLLCHSAMRDRSLPPSCQHSGTLSLHRLQIGEPRDPAALGSVPGVSLAANNAQGDAFFTHAE